MSTASNRVILLEDILERLLNTLDEYDMIESNIDGSVVREFKAILDEARKTLGDTESY